MPKLDRTDVLATVDLEDILNREVGPAKLIGGKPFWPSIDPTQRGTGKSPPTHIHRIDASGIQYFKDFNSGLYGTAIDVLMITRSMTVREALLHLADNQPAAQHPHRAHRQPTQRPPGQPPSTEFKEWVNVATERLWSERHEPTQARTWLHNRGYATHTIKQAQVGYDPGHWNDDQFPTQTREPHGIPKGRGIVFPLFNHHNELTYAQTRTLDWTPQADFPKYLNPKGLLNPRVGCWPATNHNNVGAPVIITEGPTDALAALNALQPHTGYGLATIIGAGNAAHHATTTALTNMFGTDRPYIVMTDPDPAGQLAAHWLIARLWENGATAVNSPPPNQHDLAEWLATSQNHQTEFDTALNEALTRITTATTTAISGKPGHLDIVAGGPLKPDVQRWINDTTRTASPPTRQHKPISL